MTSFIRRHSPARSARALAGSSSARPPLASRARTGAVDSFTPARATRPAPLPLTGPAAYPVRADAAFKASYGKDIATYLRDSTASPADKLQDLSAKLRELICAADGTRRAGAPFDDLEAGQAVFTAAANLSRDEALSRLPAGQSPDAWLVDGGKGGGAKLWKDAFMSLVGTPGVMAFGDKGWHPDYQDGTPGQTVHFASALHHTYFGLQEWGASFPQLWAAHAAARAHEQAAIDEATKLHDPPLGADILARGGSREDLRNSYLGVDQAFKLATTPSYTPADFARDVSVLLSSEPGPLPWSDGGFIDRLPAAPPASKP